MFNNNNELNDIDYFLSSYLFVDDDNLYSSIFHKKEFNEIKIMKDIDKKNLLNHQLFIQRFLSTVTPYNEILLFHEMGTGKTKTAISAIENAIDNYKSFFLDEDQIFSKPLIITPNEKLIINFLEQVIEYSVNSNLTLATLKNSKYEPKSIKNVNFDIFTNQFAEIISKIDNFIDFSIFFERGFNKLKLGENEEALKTKEFLISKKKMLEKNFDTIKKNKEEISFFLEKIIYFEFFKNIKKNFYNCYTYSFAKIINTERRRARSKAFLKFRTNENECKKYENELIEKFLQQYSNTFIVLDECHNLQKKEKEEVNKVYFEYECRVEEILREYFRGTDELLLPLEDKIRIYNEKNPKVYFNCETFEKTSTEPDKKLINTQYVYVEEDIYGFGFYEKKIKSVKSNRKEISEPPVKIDKYSEFYWFLHNVKNCKIILMTGTPMENKITEFANVMNLILPQDKNFSSSFENDYFIKNNEVFYDFKKDKIQDFKKVIKGRVSYLKFEDKIEKNLIKNTVEEEQQLDQLNIYQVKLQNDSEQLIGYEESLKLDEEQTGKKEEDDEEEEKEEEQEDERKFQLISPYGLGTNSIQASLFSIQIDDENYYGDKLEKLLGKNIFQSIKTNQIKETFISERLNSGNTFEEKLEILKNFSCKFAFVIEELLKNQNKNSFIYCKQVKGSGIELLGYLLNLFGYERATKENKNKISKKYILFLDESEKINKDLKDVFNQDDNYDGKYIQVVLGSEKIAEGFSFKNIQNEYILSPWWNYAEIDQAIGRGRRYNSHKKLIELYNEGILTEEPKLTIYQLASVISTDVDSIDMIIWNNAEIKDINNKMIEKEIKKSAVDCFVNHSINIKNETFDNTRDCEYDDCDYECDFLETDIIRNNYQPILKKTNYTTYFLYYFNSSDIIEKIKEGIHWIFSQTNLISFEKLFLQITKYLTEKKKLQINLEQAFFLEVLSNFILNFTKIKNKNNQECFLKCERNYFYLIEHFSYDQDIFSVYYTEHPILNKNLMDTGDEDKTLTEYYLENHQLNIEENIYNRLQHRIENDSIFFSIVKLLNKNQQSDLFEISYESYQIERDNNLLYNVNRFYRDFYKEIDGMIFHWIKAKSVYNLDEYHKDIRVFYKNEWFDCSSNELFKKTWDSWYVETWVNFYNTLNYCGFLLLTEKDGKVFRIFDKKKESQTKHKDKGIICGSGNLKYNELFEKIFSEKIEEKMTKEELCKIFKQKFSEINLLFPFYTNLF